MATSKKKPAAKQAAKNEEPKSEEPTAERPKSEQSKSAEPKAEESKNEQQSDDKEQTPDYEPKHLELENAGFDHHAAEEKRLAELAEEREEHNRRTGDASRR